MGRTALALIAALAFASCSSETSRPVESVEPPVVLAPLLVEGIVLDSEGIPMPNAHVQLSVWDTVNAQIGQPVPMVIVRDYTAGPEGAFAIRLHALPELKRHAAANGGWVNFRLELITATGLPIAFWGFPRQIQGNAWAEDVPVVELRPLGT